MRTLDRWGRRYWSNCADQLGFPVGVIVVVSIRRLRLGGAVRCNVEELASRCSGIVLSEIKVLASDARQRFVRLMLVRLMRSDRIRADLLLRLLLRIR